MRVRNQGIGFESNLKTKTKLEWIARGLKRSNKNTGKQKKWIY